MEIYNNLAVWIVKKPNGGVGKCQTEGMRCARKMEICGIRVNV
jgi:hypothetical protein